MRLDSELLALERKLAAADDQVSLARRDVTRLGQQITEAGRAGIKGLPTPLARVSVSVKVFGTIPGDPTAAVGAAGMPQLPGITVDIYVHATGEHVATGTTDANGILTIGCWVPLALTTYSAGNFHFYADITATPPASTAARYTGAATVTNVLTSDVSGPPYPAIQLVPSTGFDFWLNGAGTPLKSNFTITDSIAGTVNVTQAGSFTGTIAYNYPGVLGGCAPAVGVPITYVLDPTSTVSWQAWPIITMSYPASALDCPQASGTHSISEGFANVAGGPPYFTAAPFSAVIPVSWPLYSSTATITVVET